MNTRFNGIIRAIAVSAALSLPLALSAQTVKASAAGVDFELRVIGNEVEVTLSAKTTGWVAFGLDPSRRMKGAGIVIGYVKDGKASADDQYGNSDISHKPDVSLGGANDILSVSGTEADGVTTLTIRLPRLSRDSLDGKFTQGKHKLILAYGTRDDFSSKHRSAGSVDIDIQAP